MEAYQDGHYQSYRVSSINNFSWSCSGYSFVGWNTKANGTGKSYLPGTTVNKSVINLFAQWKKK